MFQLGNLLGYLVRLAGKNFLFLEKVYQVEYIDYQLQVLQIYCYSEIFVG